MLLWWIGLAAGGAILSLNLHELAHCLAAWTVGGHVTSYRPWPHWVDRTDGSIRYKPGPNRQFFIGRMTWTLDHQPTRPECHWFYGIIPLRAGAFLALWLPLGLLVFLPLLALAFWDLLDLGDWIKDYLWSRKSQDGGKFRSC